METLKNLQAKLSGVLAASIQISDAEKEFLLESIDFFNEDELHELIQNNSPRS